MSRLWPKRAEADRGQVLVIFALSVTGLMLMLALILDGGRVYSERRRVQNAADAAATAGAAVLNHNTPAASLTAVQQAACKAAKDNGFGSGVPDSTCGPTGSVVKIHVPGSGDGVGMLTNVNPSFEANGYVQVGISSTFTSFVQTFLGGSQIGASALGVAVNIPGSGIGWSMLVLNPADCESFFLNGTNATLTVHNGGLMVDSAAAKSSSPTCPIKNAAVVSGSGATITTDPPYTNSVVGTGDNAPGVTPPFSNGADFVVDPLAFVHVPDFGQLGPSYVANATHPSIAGQPAALTSPTNPSRAPQPWTSSAAAYPNPMPPGVVWGGIQVHNGDILILRGGTYIMAGGGFDITGGSVFALNPVTIIMTNDKFCNSGDSTNCTSGGLKGNGDLGSTVGQTTGGGPPSSTDSWGSPAGFACTASTATPATPAACQPFAAPSVNPDGEDYLNNILIYIDREIGPCDSGGIPSVGNTTFVAGGNGAYYFADGSIIYAPCSSVDLFGSDAPFQSHAGSVESFNVQISGNKTIDLGGPGPVAPARSKTGLVQ